MDEPKAAEGRALYAADDVPLAESVVARSLGVGWQASGDGDIQLAASFAGAHHHQLGDPPDRRVGIEESRQSRRRESGIVFHNCPQSPPEDGDGDVKDAPPHREAITLPQSTHTLLFTENICSLPFGFAFFILGISITCLILALYDNLDHPTPNNPLNVPANVSATVRVAQFISLVVAVLTEEEVPTALYLLRNLPKSSLGSKLGLAYWKFVASNVGRLVVGYLFLLNVYLVLVQADGFVSMIDDLAFKLCTLDVLGKRLRNATSATCFRTEFERKPYLFRKKMTVFTKIVFCVNFLALFFGIGAVALMQRQGRFQCGSITVNFGDDVWETAYVDTGGEEVLVYSYFNGLYKMNGTHAGRPMYRERRKSGDDYFGEKVIGAVIMYCEEEDAWIFTHEKIRKTKAQMESSCPWLLRSPVTDTYDLMDVASDSWQIWVGTIATSELSITCNECQTDTDCNLNGICMKDKVCNCTNPDYEGRHCELEVPCPRLISETSNEDWVAVMDPNCTSLLREYSRPIYARMSRGGSLAQGDIDVGDYDRVSLLYSGSRWLGVRLVGGLNFTREELSNIRSDFHAFWEQVYDRSVGVSDPSKGSTPVGVDFYRIGDRGPQYGPWGVLYPIADPPGRGNFLCANVSFARHAEICEETGPFGLGEEATDWYNNTR